MLRWPRFSLALPNFEPVESAVLVRVSPPLPPWTRASSMDWDLSIFANTLLPPTRAFPRLIGDASCVLRTRVRVRGPAPENGHQLPRKRLAGRSCICVNGRQKSGKSLGIHTIEVDARRSFLTYFPCGDLVGILVTRSARVSIHLCLYNTHGNQTRGNPATPKCPSPNLQTRLKICACTNRPFHHRLQATRRNSWASKSSTQSPFLTFFPSASSFDSAITASDSPPKV